MRKKFGLLFMLILAMCLAAPAGDAAALAGASGGSPAAKDPADSRPVAGPQRNVPLPGNPEAEMDLPEGTTTDASGTQHLPASADAAIRMPGEITIILPGSSSISATGVMTVGDAAGTNATVANAAGTMSLPAGTTISAGGAVTLPPEEEALVRVSTAEIYVPAGSAINVNGEIELAAAGAWLGADNGATVDLPGAAAMDTEGTITLPAAAAVTTVTAPGDVQLNLPPGSTIAAGGEAAAPDNGPVTVKASGAAAGSVAITGTVDAFRFNEGIFLEAARITTANGTTIALPGTGTIFERAIAPTAGNRAAGQYLFVDVNSGTAIVTHSDETTETVNTGGQLGVSPDGATVVTAIDGGSTEEPDDAAIRSGSGCAAASFGLLALALLPLMRKRAR